MHNVELLRIVRIRRKRLYDIMISVEGFQTKVEFQKACLEAGIQLNEEQMNQFEKYMQLLIEWNEKMNLTAITQEEEVWEKHFYDSIMPFSNIDFETMCDIGSGAGFPGIPVKIAFPSCTYDIGGAFTKALSFFKLK